MNQLRTVAVGVYTPTEELLLCDPAFEDSWRTGLANAIDAPVVARVVTQAEAESCAGAYVMGESDFINGGYNPPHWNTPEYDAYLSGYNDEWARVNNRRLAR